MRTDIKFEIVCSACGSTLEADSEKSGTSCDSAFSLTSSIAVIPCRSCFTEALRPAKMIRDAMDIMAKDAGAL